MLVFLDFRILVLVGGQYLLITNPMRLYLVAGPTSLSDSVRRALSTGVASPRAVFNGMPTVTLHVEKFGM